MTNRDHEVFLSPFTWRYGSEDMRALWAEAHKRRLMRRVWLALADAQLELGLVSQAQVDDLQRTADDIDIDRASEIEAETHHDVMAEIRTWAEQAPVGGAIIHLGATSADITENVDALRVRDALGLVRAQLVQAMGALADRVDETADIVTLGWTHLQPAAPTTIGYRLAGALHDLTIDLADLDVVADTVEAKGFKGAVGTSASYDALVKGAGATLADFESAVAARLGLVVSPVANQVAPRKHDVRVLNLLASIAGSASTVAFNIRLMQSPPYGEWSEGFAERQVGSSAMPWKRNPINAENVNSLARFVAVLPQVAWQNESNNLLERTLDDSANRRIVLPEAFLAVDEILSRVARLSKRLIVEHGAVSRTLERFGPFAASEAVLIAAAGAGGDRQLLHEVIRRHAMAAWAVVESGGANPLPDLLATDDEITQFVEGDEVRRLVAHPELHVGDAPSRARAAASRARIAIA